MNIIKSMVVASAGFCVLATAQVAKITSNEPKQHYLEKQEAPLKNPKDIGFSDLSNVMGSWGAETLRMVGGSNALDKIERPLVTIFGGNRVKKGSKYYTMAYDIAQELVKQGCAIITGGGTGIMEASNCGARLLQTKNITSVAIGVEGIGVPNACAQEQIMVKHFYPRNWLLAEYASAFVVMPGGTGTMSELFGIVALMSHDKMPLVPLYIVGKKYWNNIKKWLDDGLKEGLISQKAYDVMIFTDDKDVVCNGIMKFIKEHQPKEKPMPAELSESLEAD